MRELKTQVHHREALLVIGMHRSGTSATSGMLARLGAQVPASLMVPTPDNPRGYWESTALMQFHDEVLASAGTGWSDWDPFNPHWMKSLVSSDFIARLPGILAREYGDARLLLVKDPRICRLLPLWRHVLAEIGIAAKFVLPVRHPLEVSRSLEARNDFGLNRSYLIWLRYMLDAELQTRGHRRVFVGYADLLADWRAQAGRISEVLDVSWPKWSSRVEIEIDTFLSSELRHHAAAGPLPGGETLTAWVERAFCALVQLQADPEATEAKAVLDRLREEFDGSSTIYAPVVRESELLAQKKAGDLAARLDQADKERGDLSGAARAAELRETGLQQALDDRDRKIAELEARLTASDVEIAEAAAKCEALGLELAARSAASEERRKEVEAGHQAEVALLRESHAQVESSLQESLKQAESSLQARFSEIAKLTRMVFDLEAQVASSQAEATRVLSESQSTLAWLEREVELCRRIASERREQLAAVRADAFWKAARSVRNLVGKPTADIALEAPAVPDHQAIVQSGLFDKAWYLDRYPDVRKRGVDPLKHYLRHGAAEGRDPGPGFSTRDYLDRYADVAASGLNPFLHYVRYGIWEGRKARARSKVAGTR